MPSRRETAIKTTIAYPRLWIPAVQAAVDHMRATRYPGARPNHIYQEALRQYLVNNGYLKDGDQA
ncbi:hypothetical protein [Symbiobacterium terraclitae]|uniref:hypothetical protein n=1 Tax=Symbiobacterium terraclitae TaxID=557451 RepID=UPI0035B54D54